MVSLPVFWIHLGTHDNLDSQETEIVLDQTMNPSVPRILALHENRHRESAGTTPIAAPTRHTVDPLYPAKQPDLHEVS